MNGEASTLSQLLDSAETLRQQGRLEEALQTVKRSLEMEPRNPRAILLLGRLLYQEGKIPEALAELRPLTAILAGDSGFKTLTQGLEQMSETRDSRGDSSFATESMAQILAQQGYYLEALTVYRQLYLVSGKQPRFWQAILQLRAHLQQEGSRGTAKETVAEEIRQLDIWIEARQRGS